MAETTKISWCDATFNPWIGCTKVSVSPSGGACDFCYAERDNKLRKWVAGWGQGVPRHRTKDWDKVRRWDRRAAVTGKRPRVFCASLADVFDNEVPEEWRTDLWALIRETPHLHWMLLTKRIGNVEKMLPADWGDDYNHAYRHVGIMISVCNQYEADRDVWRLVKLKAIHHVRWIGISAEPLLGSMNLRNLRVPLGAGFPFRVDHDHFDALHPHLLDGIGLVITGGESGSDARPTHPDHACFLRDQCEDTNTPFHFKQWGEWAPICAMSEEQVGACYRSNRKARAGEDQDTLDDIYGRTRIVRDTVLHHDGSQHRSDEPGAYALGAMTMFRIGVKAAGRLLDGVEYNGLPVGTVQ